MQVVRNALPVLERLIPHKSDDVSQYALGAISNLSRAMSLAAGLYEAPTGVRDVAGEEAAERRRQS